MSRKACTLFVALSLWQGLAVTACADARNFLTVGCDAWCQSAQWRESDYATIEAQLAAAQNRIGKLPPAVKAVSHLCIGWRLLARRAV